MTVVHVNKLKNAGQVGEPEAPFLAFSTYAFEWGRFSDLTRGGSDSLPALHRLQARGPTSSLTYPQVSRREANKHAAELLTLDLQSGSTNASTFAENTFKFVLFILNRLVLPVQDASPICTPHQATIKTRKEK